MNINDLVKTILAVIGALGGVAVIVGGVSAWLGKIWADKLYLIESAKRQKEIEEFKNQYVTELEHLRAELTERHALFNATFTALSSGYVASHERVVSAMEELWNAILKIRGFVSPYIFLYEILLPREYVNVPIDNALKLIPKLSQKEFDISVKGITDIIEDKRPFIGERLWFVFFIYRAFAIRQAYKIVQGRDKGKLYKWDKNNDGSDDTQIDALRYVLTSKELATVINAGPIKDVGVPQRILDAIERKMLDEMNEWIFGKRLIDMSIEEQERVASLLSSLRHGSR